MESFVIRMNIEHYQRLLERTSDDSTRQRVRQLLKEEEAKLGRNGKGKSLQA
jgi:hypothetical protein